MGSGKSDPMELWRKPFLHFCDFLWLAKERHYCVLLFFLIGFYIFDKCLHFKKCGSTLILNWWSLLSSWYDDQGFFFLVFFLLLLSNVCNYLFLGLGGERIRRKYSAKISHVVFSCPSCLVTSPSTHPPTHPPTNPSNLHWPCAMNQVLYWALDLGWNKLGSPAHKGDQKIGILQWKNVKIGHFYHRRILQPGWGDFRESFQDEVLCQLTHDRWS